MWLTYGSSHKISLIYGPIFTSDYTVVSAQGTITVNAWTHVLITYDGGTTGGDPADDSLYYSRFKIFLNGVNQTLDGTLGGAGTCW